MKWTTTSNRDFRQHTTHTAHAGRDAQQLPAALPAGCPHLLDASGAFFFRCIVEVTKVSLRSWNFCFFHTKRSRKTTTIFIFRRPWDGYVFPKGRLLQRKVITKKKTEHSDRIFPTNLLLSVWSETQAYLKYRWFGDTRITPSCISCCLLLFVLLLKKWLQCGVKCYFDCPLFLVFVLQFSTGFSLYFGACFWHSVIR